MNDSKYMDVARRVLQIKLDKDGTKWAPEHDLQAKRIAYGMDRLLDKTFSVGGAGASGSPVGGAALVKESIGNGYREDPDYEDVGDALTHVNQPTNMYAPGSDIKYTGTVMEDAHNFLPPTSLKKPSGWLSQIPDAERPAAFSTDRDRELGHVFDAKQSGELNPAIAIDGQLGDGYARAHLAHALGEKFAVAHFKSKSMRKSELHDALLALRNRLTYA